MKEGVFWIIGENLNDLKNGNFQMITCFDKNAAHRDVWENFKRKDENFYRCDYEYFPRGRVWEKSGQSVIFLNDVIDMPSVIKEIVREFDLKKFQVVKDPVLPNQFLNEENEI